LFVKICNISEVDDGSLARFDVQNKAILVARMGKKFFAADTSCTHEESDLSLGLFSDGIVTCPLHTAKFEIGSGKVVEGPNGDDPASIEALRTFKTEVRGGELWADLP
jgi:3-phenylpropionate/trans-cinnamate dioxygenase ferredoxin component